MQGSYSPVPIQVAQLPIGQLVPVIFFFIFVVWLLYTVVASYHWLRYANNQTLAYSMITAHLLISIWLAIYAVSGIH